MSSEAILKHLRQAAVAYVVLVVALLLTVFAWHYVYQSTEASERGFFDEASRTTEEAIDRRMDDYIDGMLGARGLFLASESVEREEWRSYAEGIELERRYEGLQAMGYAEYVGSEEREESLQTLREEGLPEMRPGGEREEYFPVTYVEPSNKANQDMLGRDPYPEPAHRAAMDRARDTGSPEATGMIYVLSQPGENTDLTLKPGFALYLPIYRKGEPHGTVDERRRALEGFVFGTFRMDRLLGGAFGDSFSAIDFEVYDGDPLRGDLLYNRDGILHAAKDAGHARFSQLSQLDVAGQEWSLYFSTLPEFEERAEARLPLLVLVSGIAVSLVLFATTLMLVRSRIVAERASGELRDANRELEAFTYSVSHDLRAPLRSIDGFSQILLEDYSDKLDKEGEEHLGRVRAASQRMGRLIDDLLGLSRVTRGTLRRETVDLSALAADIAEDLEGSQPERRVEFVIAKGLFAEGDSGLLRVALENLLGNAWKFTGDEPEATIEFGYGAHRGSRTAAYYVRDSGAGFDMAYADKLFGVFQRLHSEKDFEGTGVGLATVWRVIGRHGGRVWAEGEVGKGATFYFTLRRGAS